ncbi:hypothetical protein ACJMK2_026725 [Sinanodonta woodiana]|uniref:BHLH domain-containing protein n=1 Tax=Sinanodonta woodiana TaxID=1069815 RepID=A0ABD3XMB7_SINWO
MLNFSAEADNCSPLDSRTARVYQSFGDRMHTDKELNDLLDFSAMFSPPVSNSMKNVPQNPGPSPMDPLYTAYKQGEQVGSWTGGNPPSGFAESRMFPNNQVYNGQESSLRHYGNNNDIPPPLISKNPDHPFPPRMPGYPSRDSAISPQGMMGSNMTMSPNSLTPEKQVSPYYFNSKRPSLEESMRVRRPSGPSGKRPKGSVYSPSPDEFGQDSPGRYTPSKPMYPPPAESYFMDPSHNSADPWSSNVPGGHHPTSTYPSSMLPGNSYYTQGSSHATLHHPHEMGYHHSMSPSQDSMMNSGLPPMSTFRGNTIPPNSSTTFSSPSPTVNGSDMMGGGGGPGPSRSVSNHQGSSQQTGDALGKALASIYSTDHTSSSYGSNPSTPVSSPPPMTGPSGQWQRPSQNTTTSPHFEGPLHSLGRMEERLDDAIHVLRTHAEGQMPGMQGHPPGLSGMMQGPHSNGVMGNLGYPGMGIPSSHIESHMPGAPSLTDSRSHSLSTAQESQKTYDFGSDQQSDVSQDSVKMEKHDRDETESNKSENTSKTEDSSKKSDPSGPPPPHKKSRSEPEEDDSPETKVERERLRRQANNARERLRVRDINDAFKELGQMVTMHCGTTQPITKLMILEQAVNIITSLEARVRERNLNPKAACLKRREEEKTDELPARTINTDAQPGPLPGKCVTDESKPGGWW